MKQYIKVILLLILITIVGAGCWDRKELNTLGIVAGLGVDLDETDPDKIRITAQVINPSAIAPSISGGGGGGSGAPPVLNQKVSGYTVLDAIRKSTLEPSRRLYFPHNQILVVSEELARTKGTEYFLDFFMRDPEPRRSTWILVSKDKASEVFEFRPILDEVPATAIAETLQSWSATSQVYAVNIHQFTQELMSQSSAPIAAYIERINNDIRLSGMAVFKGTRMVGILTPAETRGLLWMRNQVKSGIIVVQCNKDNRKVSLEIMQSQSKVTPEIRDGQIYMKIDVKVISNLASQYCSHDLTSKEALTSLASQQNTVIENEIKACIRKAQELGADFLLLGDAIYRKYPKKWKELKSNWDEIFPTIKTEINVTSTIRQVGMILQPVVPPGTSN